jgi:hypothetical protein
MERSCGDCNLCCKVLGVGAVQKKNLTWCQHCDIGKGCRIYETRPEECRDFKCLWLVDASLPPEFRPTRSRFVPYFKGKCLVIDCDTPARNIHLDKKYAALFARLAANLEPHGGFVSVCYGEHMVAITPREIFDLGATRRTHQLKVSFNPVLRMIEKISIEAMP